MPMGFRCALLALAGTPIALVQGVAQALCREEMPPSSIDDNYCDCTDGSDEPGTGACSGQEETLFLCQNSGSTPQMVYASRVGDGICDCCDGSDEAQTPLSTCQNTCKEEGERQRADREAKIKDLRAGLQVKTAAIAQAKQQMLDKQQELLRVEDELPSMEVQLAELRKKKERQ
ncbi:unnamed protein product [Effrenium voratum]|nr:unnamed protein product [Effrenium voratum]